jgi:hypothetical protein
MPSFPGMVRQVDGAEVAHVTVRVEGDGSAETSDSGEFSFPLAGNLKIGFPATFHVANWVILKPCELKNGRVYLRDPSVEPIEIFVLRPHDSRLKTAIIGCLIEEQTSHHAPDAPSGRSPRGSLSEERNVSLAESNPHRDFYTGRIPHSGSHSLLLEAAYISSFAQDFSHPTLSDSDM